MEKNSGSYKRICIDKHGKMAHVTPNPTPDVSSVKPRQTRHCTKCGNAGHYSKTCKRARDIDSD